MDGDESKSLTKQEDSQNSPKISMTLEETIDGFQECFKDIIVEIEEDGKFSEMTAEKYDKKNSYMRKHLDELSRLHKLLIEEVSKNYPSLIQNAYRHPSDSTSGSAVKDDASKVKDAKTEKFHLDANESEVVELQKQVGDLKLVISESDSKIKTMEEELEKSRKRLSIANDLISNLKGESSSNLFQENQELKLKLDSKQNQVDMAAEYVTSRDREVHELEGQMDIFVVELGVRDAKIKKLKTKNDQYKSDVKRLEEILKSKEDIWNHDVAKLKGQLKNQMKSFDDLKKQLGFSRSERTKISSKMETLKEENDKLIQELDTRLKALQVENERVVSSFENAEKLKNELTVKVVELEREVERQKEVISVTKEEKLEAIRQLSFTLQHYVSKCKQLRQSSAANKTGCFDFLSCLITL